MESLRVPTQDHDTSCRFFPVKKMHSLQNLERNLGIPFSNTQLFLKAGGKTDFLNLFQSLLPDKKSTQKKTTWLKLETHHLNLPPPQKKPVKSVKSSLLSSKKKAPNFPRLRAWPGRNFAIPPRICGFPSWGRRNFLLIKKSCWGEKVKTVAIFSTMPWSWWWDIFLGGKSTFEETNWWYLLLMNV